MGWYIMQSIMIGDRIIDEYGYEPDDDDDNEYEPKLEYYPPSKIINGVAIYDDIDEEDHLYQGYLKDCFDD